MNFLFQALKNPRRTGAVTPSSSFLAQSMVDQANLPSARVVVELGVGTGAFTHKILENLSKNSHYLGVEINEHFVAAMGKEHPHINLVHGSAEHLSSHLSNQGYDRCDRIISGIPWVSFEENLQEVLLQEISTALTEDGLFLTFAYWPINHMKNGRALKQKLSHHFGEVEETPLTLNFPPAFIYICRKK